MAVEIRIAGRIDIDWSDWFAGMDVCRGPGDDTILTGHVRDQAELYGVLSKLRDLGLRLISVNNAAAPHSPDEPRSG